MSDNVALVKRSFAAMSAWDVEALLQLYDPDVEYLPLTGTRVESGGYRATYDEALHTAGVDPARGHA